MGGRLRWLTQYRNRVYLPFSFVSFISLVVLGRRGEVTACLMAVKFPDWWSVLVLGERCLRLIGKDEFFLVEEAVCSVVFTGIKSLVLF